MSKLTYLNLHTGELLCTGQLPEPLRLAAMLEKTMQWPLHGKAAAELRKLHAEFEAIKQAEKQEPTGKQSLQVEQEPVAEVKLKTTGGNVGIATVIHEIYSHYREPLRVGDKLYTTPPAQPAQQEPVYKVTVVDDQHPNGVPLSQWGNTPTPPSAQQELTPDDLIATYEKGFNDCAAQRQPLTAWQPIQTALPQPGQPVLVACGTHVIRAAHAPKFALSEDLWGEFLPDGGEYDEATDTTYWPEGWYEWNHHEETHWQLDKEPTHWMPLPDAPADHGITNGGDK